MVLVQNLKFLHCFLLGTFLLEKVFADVLYRKLAFFKHKNIALKKSQNLHFFGQKLPLALFFRFGKFGGFVNRKLAFLNL